MANVIEILKRRGFIDQVTSDELGAAVEKPILAYVGFDPTADSLHLGNLVGIVALAWFQKLGHTPVVVLGGATGRIGDPSGKSEERPLLSESELQHNLDALQVFFQRILSFQTGPKPLILNNQNWLQGFSTINFLRDVGKHFRLGQMLAKESVRSRLQSEEGMSFTEFSYQILQAYDFHYLSKQHGVQLQMGGSDQWGNITAGIEYHRKVSQQSLYGLTFPLLTRSDGKKFGKTEGGAIWLSEAKLSSYHFYQHLYRVLDSDVITLLRMLTFLEIEAIEEIERSMKREGYTPNSAQKILAHEVTRFVHGEEGLERALRASENMAPGADANLSLEALKQLQKDLPHVSLPASEIIGYKFADVASKVGLTTSKSEANRLIQNGGAYFNNTKVQDAHFQFQASDLIEGSYLIVSSGKKKRILIIVQ